MVYPRERDTGETRFVVADDGARIAYRIIGEGPRALFIHGWATDSNYWWPLYVLARRFTLILVDLRGSGQSEKKPPYTTVRVAKDVLLVAEREKPDFVVGHSWGGAIAQRVAVQYQPKGLVLMSTFAKLSSFSAKLADWALPFLERSDMESFARIAVKLGAHMAHENADWLYDIYRRADRDVVLQSARDILRYDGRNLLPRIQSPTLILHGEHDGVVSPDHGRYLHRRIKGSVMLCVPDAGHDIVMEATKAVHLSLRGFFENVLEESADKNNQ